MEAGPSYSKPRLCHLFLGKSLCSRDRTREEIRKVEYSEMPVDWSSRCHASSTERVYCIPEFFDNSPIKLWLIRVESAAKEIHPVGSYASIFAPAFARDWPLQSVSTAVTFTFAFRYLPLAPPSVRSALPCSYLNNRSTLSQVLSAHSYRSYLPRKFIASFNNALFFSFVWTSSGSKARYFHLSNDKRTRPEC